MNKLLKIIRGFVQGMSLPQFTFFKLCVCSVGVILGLCAPRSKKKPIFIISAILFVATFIPLVVKFCAGALRVLEEDRSHTFVYETGDELPWD